MEKVIDTILIMIFFAIIGLAIWVTKSGLPLVALVFVGDFIFALRNNK